MRSERNHRRRFFALSHRIISELFVHAVRYEIQPMRMYLVKFFSQLHARKENRSFRAHQAPIWPRYTDFNVRAVREGVKAYFVLIMLFLV